MGNYLPPKKEYPSAPDWFLAAAKKAALHSYTDVDDDLCVLDCKIHVREERSIPGSNKPVQDIGCGFKDEHNQFFNFKLTLWEELVHKTGPVLEQYAAEKWLHVIVDLATGYNARWTNKKTGDLQDSIQIKTAWIILQDGTRIPVHRPMDAPYPPEIPDEEFVPDDDDDPWIPPDDDPFDGVVEEE